MRRKTGMLALVLLLASSIAFARSATGEAVPQVPLDPAGWSVTYNVQYGPSQFHFGDVYAPTSPACFVWNGQCEVPAVLIIHGGGWTCNSDKRGETGTSQLWATEGWFVFNVNYDPTDTPPHQTCTINGAGHNIGSLQLALRFMRTGLHQLGYQFSDEAIVTDGASAGGYNSAITVVASPNLWPSPYSDLLPGVSVAVLGGIDEFGPSGDVPPYDPAPDGAVVPHITPATPPLYIIQGSRDCTVIPQNSTNIYNALVANGVTGAKLWAAGIFRFLRRAAV